MPEIPWLLLVAAVSALAGAAVARFVAARTGGGDRLRHWYEERKSAYVELLAIFERDTYRLRAAYEAGQEPGPALAYVDEVAHALMQVRLLASGSVRSAALAVHLLLRKMHGEMNPTAVPGVQPQTHFRELLAQVPLVTQQLEAAIRDELSIELHPPTRVGLLNGHLPGRRRIRWRRPAREPALDDLAKIGQDHSRD